MEPLVLNFTLDPLKTRNEKIEDPSSNKKRCNSLVKQFLKELSPESLIRDITFVAEVSQPIPKKKVAKVNVQKKVVKIVQDKPFAPPTPAIVARLVSSYLTVEERAHFFNASREAAMSLRQTNYTLPIPDFLKSLDPQKYCLQLEAIQGIISHKKLQSPLSTRNEKKEFFNQEIYRIIKPMWRKDNQLQNNEELSFFVLTQDMGQFDYVSLELRTKEEFIFRIIEKNGSILQFVSSKLKKNKQFVLMAVAENGMALEYAFNKLRKNKEIALTAVMRDGLALLYTADKLKQDKEVVLAAVTQDGWALQYASDELKEDRDVVLAAVRQNGSAYCYASATLKQNKEIALAAVSQDGVADLLLYASAELRQNKDVVLAAVARDGTALQYASDELRKDKDIVLAAVTQNVAALQYASTELQCDRDILAVKKNSSQNLLFQKSNKVQMNAT